MTWTIYCLENSLRHSCAISSFYAHPQMTSKLQLAEESSAEPFVIFGGTESRRTVNTMKSLYDIVVLALMLPINLFWTLNVNVIRYARKTISILSSFFSPLFMFLNWLGFFCFFFFWGVILNTRHTQYSVCKIKKKKKTKKEENSKDLWAPFLKCNIS